MIYILIIFCLCGGYIMGVLTVCMLQHGRDDPDPIRVVCGDCRGEITVPAIIDGKTACPHCKSTNLQILFPFPSYSVINAKSVLNNEGIGYQPNGEVSVVTDSEFREMYEEVK